MNKTAVARTPWLIPARKRTVTRQGNKVIQCVRTQEKEATKHGEGGAITEILSSDRNCVMLTTVQGRVNGAKKAFLGSRLGHGIRLQEMY